MNIVNGIPDKITNFNVYEKGDKLIGVSGEVTLPDIEFTSDTLSGAGIGGEIESPTVGHVAAMEMEIPFNTLYGSITTVFRPNKSIELTLRASVQIMDSGTGEVSNKPIRVVIRGVAKKLALGKVTKGEMMDCSVSLGVLYIKVEVDGNTRMEIDPLNMICNVGGEDILAEVRNQI